MKRTLIISGLAAAIMAVVVPAGISSSELDLPGLNQRIDNIDARTTNNEADIGKLQEATQTPTLAAFFETHAARADIAR